MKKRLILTIAIISSIVLHAQTPNDDAARRALQVGHTMQQERVFLHFDNDAYYLGETMWFKAYVSYGTNDRTSSPSKVLYVELVAPEGYIVETKKYKIDDNGCCNGEFELNPLLLSGYYEVRAYTRYMTNWGKEAIFSRVFPIFDKVNGDNWDFKNMLDRKRQYMENGKWISSELPDAELKFYPEGGHLVAGLKSKVAYELRGLEGDFLKEDIRIYADNNLLLTTTPTHFGKGTFEMTPQAGVKYTAKVTAKDKKEKSKEFEFNLPTVEEEGVTLTAGVTGDSISFTINNNFTEGGEYAFSILYRGAMGYYKKIAASEKVKTFTLNKNELPEGVNKAIVFSGKTPLAERCFFITHDSIQKSDRSTIKLVTKSNNEDINELSLAPYEKITLDIAREDGQPIPSNANLSLAVSDAAGNVQTSWNYNIYTYLLLGSELKGYIPNAAQYFDKKNEKRKENLDLVMLTNGWTAYDWRKLTQDTLSNLQPIERGITIKGMFFRKTRLAEYGKKEETVLIPQKNNRANLTISYDGEETSSYSFRTDSAGKFILETKDFYGKRIAALIPQTTIRQNNNIRYAFALDRYYSPDYRPYNYWERNTGIPIDEDIKKDSIVQINPFEFMLSQVEVVSSAKKEQKSRPPHSEMRLNFLDEWEYAQDVSYLKNFYNDEDDVFEESLREMELNLLKDSDLGNDSTSLAALDALAALKNNEGVINGTSRNINEGQTKYVGRIRYTGADSEGFSTNANPVIEEFQHSLTAADVVTSAMKRHNYNWAYWVQFMVVQGEYDSNSVPTPDFEYLRGETDVEKMMNFKEFVIRSDAKTRQLFENTFAFWNNNSALMDRRIAYEKFYRGFLSQHYVAAKKGVDNFPNPSQFSYSLQLNFPVNPNYVACFIPYSEEEKKQNSIMPDLHNSLGTVRYTSLQGYNESKQFYSPDYSRAKPSDEHKEHRRTLLWNPQLTINADGTATAELYNSYSCNTITVDIAGRDGQALYSNDPVTTTRIKPQSTQTAAVAKSEQEPESDENFMEQKMDSAMEQACYSEHSMAMAYYNQKKYKNAIMIWSELVKYKYAPALNYVALCYLNGTGLTKNEEYAKRFFENAAMNGNPEGQYELAMLYKKGIGCEQNDSLAIVWLRRASMQKEPRAMTERAKYLLATNNETDTNEAVSLLAEAVKSGNANAQYQYGKLMVEKPAITGNQPADEGIKLIRAAAAQEQEEAMLYMMEYEHNAQNYTEAYRHAKALSLAKRHEGTKRMADYYLNGQGVKRDKGLAKDLYRQAANGGNKEAAEILKEL